VARIPSETQFARAAPRVYLADDATPDQLRRAGRSLDHADKLVTERAVEARVAARDLKVCVADARERYAHHRLARARRLRDIRHAQTRFVESESFHK
jgi:hypothetical protein